MNDFISLSTTSFICGKYEMLKVTEPHDIYNIILSSFNVNSPFQQIL